MDTENTADLALRNSSLHELMNGVVPIVECHLKHSPSSEITEPREKIEH